MAWTDDRVETLKKLWSEGLSASQIAKQLGGVTRNAVIGKVHRLGLSGRATPSRPPQRRVTTPKPTQARVAKPSAPAQAKPAAKIAATSAKPAAVPAVAERVAPSVPVEAQPLPNGEYATVLTLKDSMCKWPIGDPADATFRFCGRKSQPGHAYCDAHASMAYQPQQKRKRKTTDANSVLDALGTGRRANV